jgi:hypothetical protein
MFYDVIASIYRTYQTDAYTDIKARIVREVQPSLSCEFALIKIAVACFVLDVLTERTTDELFVVSAAHLPEGDEQPRPGEISKVECHSHYGDKTPAALIERISSGGFSVRSPFRLCGATEEVKVYRAADQSSLDGFDKSDGDIMSHDMGMFLTTCGRSGLQPRCFKRNDGAERIIVISRQDILAYLPPLEEVPVREG